MSSLTNSNPNPWTTKDCSQGICSMYCPQWCYILYSPPPPSFLFTNYDDDDDNNHSAFEFSPLIVALIGILASTFILVTYYTIISRLCRRRRNTSTDDAAAEEDGENNELGLVSSSSSRNSGLDETLIKSITVMKYKTENAGATVVQGRECSVCLSEFEESQSLRLLPKCNHAFHLPCIDTWLKSHATCPLCRSTISPSPSPNSNSNSNSNANSNSNSNSNPNSFMEPPANVVINAMEYRQRSSDVVVVVVESFDEERDTVVSFCDLAVSKSLTESGDSVE